MRSPWSVGLFMIVFAGLGLTKFGQSPQPLGPAQYAIAGVLTIAGALMFLRKPFTTYVALAAAGLVVVSGLLAFSGHPELALPFPPVMSVVVGLYLILRTLIARLRRRRAASDLAPPGDEVR
jgi:hypothetical protein